MAAKLQRFDFGSLRDFRGPVVSATLAAVDKAEPPPPPPPIYSQSDLDAARIEAKQAGYQEGFLAGSTEAKASTDAQASDSEKALIALGSLLADLDKRYAATLAQQSKEVSELSLLIAKKVAGDALDARSEEAAVSLVAGCLPLILSKPKLVIELHPDTVPKTESRLREYLAAQRYEGELICRDNPVLAPHDARIDWVLGHAERSTAALWQEIESLIRTIPTPITFHPTGD